MFKSFLIFILIFILKIILFILPYKSLTYIVSICFFSFIIYPIFCSMFKSEKKIKYKYFKNVKVCFLASLILCSFGISSSFLITFAAKLNSFKFLYYFLASLQASLFLMLMSKFAFLPCIKQEINVIYCILLSFKLTKKNYNKTFAVILKTYFLYILIFPIPWAIKNYVKEINILFKKSSGGDDGVRTHDLLNAIQTRSQLRHAPKTNASNYIKNNY